MSFSLGLYHGLIKCGELLRDFKSSYFEDLDVRFRNALRGRNSFKGFALLFFLAACTQAPNEVGSPSTLHGSSSPSSSSPTTGPTLPVSNPFDVSLTPEQVRLALADGKEHGIVLLFRDDVMFRVRPNAGLVRDKQGNGIISLDDHQKEIDGLNELISPYSFELIYNPFQGGRSEEELKQRENEWETVAGQERPNEGSWAVLKLVHYSTDQVFALTEAARKLNFIRSVGIN